MLRRNFLVGIGIVSFWAVMMALLLRHEVFIPQAQPAAEVPSALREPTETWMGIYSPTESGDEQRVGYVNMTSKPYVLGDETGTKYGMIFRLATTLLSIPTELHLSGSAHVQDGQGLKRFEFSAESFDEHVIRASGQVEGGRLNVNIETAGETFPVNFPMGNDLLVQGSFGAGSLNLPVLEIGDTVFIDTFDPLTMSKGKARVTCIGMETLVFDDREVVTKILETDIGGITSTTWVDLNEEVMRVETPVGLVLKRITRHEAMEDFEDNEVRELINVVAVHPTGLKPFRGAKRMRIRLSNLPEFALVPIGGMQQAAGPDEYVIEVPAAPEAPTPAVERVAFREYLEGDPFVQVGHPKIARAAGDILEGVEDSWMQSQALYDWVYENVDKVPVLSFPSALDVLESREGDCNEHTVLYTALSRTSDIPTRIAIGLVWSDELDGFYYHAWPEVYVGDWIPVDPTLGQPIADATHIKLLEGSLSQWPKLAPFMGRIAIEVLKVE